MPGESSDSAVVLDNVRRLRDEPSPLLEDAERVLTDGYAWVLRAETERLRMRASLEQRATSLERADRNEVVELAALAQAIARVGAEIEQLRAALSELAARLSRLRMV